VRQRIVIFDRYALDSAARLRFFYGVEEPFDLQNRIIDGLSPRPLCAFFLDVDPAASLTRKDDNWSLQQLEAQARLYREECSRHAATRMDAERPGEELAAAIAHAVWRRLG